jgi:cytoskeleton protein RodZ
MVKRLTPGKSLSTMCTVYERRHALPAGRGDVRWTSVSEQQLSAVARTLMESLGSQLKAARSQRKTSLEKIADDTRISLNYLKCLEEGRYSELPGGMYNRAFLRAYCDYLGLDSRAFLQRYELESTPQTEKVPKLRPKAFQPVSYQSPHPILIWSGLLAATIVGLYFSRSWITAVFSPYFSRPPAAPIVAQPAPTAPAAAAAQPQAGGPAANPREQPRPDAAPPSSPSQQPSAAPANATQAQAPPVASAPAEPLPAATAEPARAPADAAIQENAATPAKTITIRFHATQKCWASVSSDGKRVFSNTLQPGDEQSFDAAQHFSVVLGNAGGVELMSNGKPAKPLGKPGEVVKVLIDGQSIPNLIEKSTG